MIKKIHGKSITITHFALIPVHQYILCFLVHLQPCSTTQKEKT